MNTITNFDFSILNWIHEHITCSFLDFIMPKITLLGNGGAIWIASAVIMLFFRKSRKTGIMLGSGLCSGVLIGNILLKNLVARGRPCWINKSYPASDIHPAGLLVSLGAHNVLFYCSDNNHALQQKARRGCFCPCRYDRFLKTVPLCAFPDRRYGRSFDRNRYRLHYLQNIRYAFSTPIIRQD